MFASFSGTQPVTDIEDIQQRPNEYSLGQIVTE